MKFLSTNVNSTFIKDVNNNIILLGIILIINLLLWRLNLVNQFSAILLIGLFFIIIFNIIRNNKFITIFTFILFIFLVQLSTGTSEWDARSIWLFHAKRIFIENNLYAQLDGYPGWSHSSYPVMYPAFAATISNVFGYWNEVFPKTATTFLIIPPLLSICSQLNNSKLNLVFIFGIGFILKSYLFNGYADAIVAVYTCALILLINNYNENNISNSYFQILIFSIILIFVKNEGFAILLVISFLLILYNKHSKIYILLFFSFLIYFIIWKLPLINYNISSGLISIDRIIVSLQLPNKFFLIFKFFIKHIYVYLLLFLLLLGLYRKDINFKVFLFPFSFIFLYSLLLVLVYLGSPYDLFWHLSSSANRALLPILLTGFVVLLSSLKVSFQKY